jgi:hypothetical protein
VQILLNQSRELIERYHALIEHGQIYLIPYYRYIPVPPGSISTLFEVPLLGKNWLH